MDNNEDKNIRDEVRQKTLGYILAALGLVAGLAWNDAIKALIEYVFPMTQNTLFAKLFYAILITLVVVVMSIYVTKLLRKSGEGNEK